MLALQGSWFASNSKEKKIKRCVRDIDQGRKKSPKKLIYKAQNTPQALITTSFRNVTLKHKDNGLTFSGREITDTFLWNSLSSVSAVNRNWMCLMKTGHVAIV